MTIKTIIFDLDGVLINLCEMHRQAFTKALTYSYGLFIEKEYHDKYLNGLPTKIKLEKLGVPRPQWERIIRAKQEITDKEIENIGVSWELQYMINSLSSLGYNLYCASNSIRQTVTKVLEKLGLTKPYIKYFGSDDVLAPKPSPELYYKCMADCGVRASETLIVEDSPVGEQAIKNSGAHKLMVKDATDLTMTKLLKRINEIEQGIYYV